MANNYDQATVQPTFPISTVTEFERELLNSYGLNSEIWGTEQGKTVYFFAPDCIREEISDLEVDLVFEHAQKGDPIAVKLQAFINENGEDELNDYVSGQFSWIFIFQEILKKPECEGIEDICVMGAFTGDKLRPGEFGGWVTRITRESVQHDGTYAAYERMKTENEFLASLDLVYQLADGNCLDQEYDPDEWGLDEEIADESRRQRHALDVVHHYLVNHGLAG